MVDDLTIRLDSVHPQVRNLVVRGGRRGPARQDRFLVPWADVVRFDAEVVQLRGPGPTRLDPDAPLGLLDDELLLRRDVLDTQIVDVVGHRVRRVSDVVLARHDRDLEAAAVDVGTSGLVHRLGLHRLSDHLAEQSIDFGDLHLTSARGHLVQLSSPASTLHQLDRGELAQLLAQLSTEHAADVAAAVEPALAAAAMSDSHAEVATRVALALEADEAGPVLAALPREQGRRLRHLRRDHAVRRRFERHRSWRRFLPDLPGTRPVE